LGRCFYKFRSDRGSFGSEKDRHTWWEDSSYILDLDDPVHHLIYNRELNYETVTVYKNLPVCLPKASQEKKTIPPNISEMSQSISFDVQNVDDSLFLSAASILAVYNCRYQFYNDLRRVSVKELKGGVGALKMRSFCFEQ